MRSSVIARRSGRRGLLIALAMLSALSGPGSAWAALTASTADLTLPAMAYSHANRVASGSITLTAEATPNCILLICTEPPGWNVTLRASNFAYSGSNSGAAIPAANLAITNARAPTRVSGDAISPTGGPRTTGITGSLDSARKTLQADDGFGIGRYQQVIDVSLLVPGRARAGTYTTTLTVTISNGP